MLLEVAIIGRGFEPLGLADRSQVLLCCCSMINDYGPLVRYYFPFGSERVLVADPDIMKHILLTNAQNYVKPPDRIK